MVELNPATALTGRVKTFLNKPEMQTLPVSCTTIKPTFTNRGVWELIRFISKALRTGAGVNVHLENFDKLTEKTAEGGFYLFSEPDQTDDFKELESSTYFVHETDTTDDMICVSDSMEEDDKFFRPPLEQNCDYPLGTGLVSIETAIYQAFLCGSNPGYTVFNLTAIRPSGLTNNQGMVSSGKASFGFILTKAYEFGSNLTMETLLAFLSSFNQELRRGGTYKNGALTTSYPVYGQHAKAYINTPSDKHPWLKKGLVLTSDFMKFSELLKDITYTVNAGVLWLEKAVVSTQSLEQPFLWLSSNSNLLPERLLGNVCREILIPSRGTCNLIHINLSHYRDFTDIIQAFEDTMTFICDLHSADHQSKAGVYLPAKDDKQVGLGVIGLANMLALNNTSYEDFTHTLSQKLTQGNQQKIRNYVNRTNDNLPFDVESLACFNDTECMVNVLLTAYAKAGRIAKDYGMGRAFCIAPTASSSFKYFDFEGNTTTPEISPPVYQITERLSETTESNETYIYGDVETASKVGFKTYSTLVDLWQQLMNATGLAHSISFNIWEDIDQDFLQWFSDSSVLTTYYRLNTNTGHLNKADQFQEIQCDCAG